MSLGVSEIRREKSIVDKVCVFMFKVAFVENVKDCLVLFVYRSEPCDTIN